MEKRYRGISNAWELSLIQSHLSDTAWISVDEGEWGYNYCMVSDEMLDQANLRIEKENEIIEQKLITKHNYLRTAYRMVARMKPKEEYYLHIKDMLTRDRLYFVDLENAAYALASFQRKEDVPAIKKILMNNNIRIDETSLSLMEDFPDTSYLEVLQEF